MSLNTIRSVYVDTELGIPIYNLENVEYWVKGDSTGEQLIPLKDIDTSIHNKIFISGAYVEKIFPEISEKYSYFIKQLLYIIYSKDSKHINNLREYFSGTSIYDFTINKNLLSQFNQTELESILMNIHLGDRNYYKINGKYVYPSEFDKNLEKRIYSFNLIKQLKIIALSIGGWNLNFSVHISYDGVVYWMFKCFEKSDISNTKVKVNDEYNYFDTNKKYTNIYMGQYHTITDVVKGIKDSNFNPFDSNIGNSINE